MNAYVYNAALYCEDCAQDIMDAIKSDRHVSDLPAFLADDRNFDDSAIWPQGPYNDNEADSPQHCDTCRVFLENPLTDDGRRYVEEWIDAFDHHADGDSTVINEWRAFYADTFAA